MRDDQVGMARTLRDPVVSGQRHPITGFRSTVRMADPESFGDRLRRIREAKKISRPDLAERAGIPYSTVAEIENKGADRTHTEYLAALADALEITIRELATGHRAPGELAAARLSEPEMSLVRAYRSATPAERKQIDAYLAGIATRPSRSKRKVRLTPLDDAGSGVKAQTKR